jgi:hypothetical protein
VEPGQELLYVRFPLSPVGVLNAPGAGFIRVDVLGAERIQAHLDVEATSYELDYELRLLTTRLGPAFRNLAGRALAEGKLKAALDEDQVRRDLAAGIRYWDGKAGTWVGRWARSNPR